MEILSSVAIILSLLVGIMLGETLAQKVFGRVKPKYVLVDVLIFAVTISAIYGLFNLSSFGMIFYVINIVIGLVTIISTRTIASMMRITEKDIGEDKLTVNIIRALSRYGLDTEEIKGVLKRSGIKPNVVDRYSELIDESIPAYAPKLLKIGTEMDEIKQILLSMQNELATLKTNELHEIKGMIKKGSGKRRK